MIIKCKQLITQEPIMVLPGKGLQNTINDNEYLIYWDVNRSFVSVQHEAKKAEKIVYFTNIKYLTPIEDETPVVPMEIDIAEPATKEQADEIIKLLKTFKLTGKDEMKNTKKNKGKMKKDLQDEIEKIEDKIPTPSQEISNLLKNEFND